MTGNIIENTAVPCSQRNLHNTGGPRSRVRTEKILASIFDFEQMKFRYERHELIVPLEITDIEEWVISLYQPRIFTGWNNIVAGLKLPSDRMLVVPVESSPQLLKNSKLKMLRSAVILSKCNRNFYLPDSPMIFTRSRLHRSIELIKLNLDQYYEVD
ncbi:MAG: hypothetical protein EOM06_09315 [Sphingobacteriia bacterium]|nr:hypothetical protein [Sphingobacteriia bacterium]